MAALDQAFLGHRILTLAHILPALVFALLAPVALVRRTPRPKWLERSLLLFGTLTGLTAYAMSAFAVGGRLEQSAVVVFNSLFLYWLWRAYWIDRRGNCPAARRSWIRAIAILFGISTTRPVMGFFFATSRQTGWPPEQFFGVAFWIGFSINTLGVEWWLRGRRRDLPLRATPDQVLFR